MSAVARVQVLCEAKSHPEKRSKIVVFERDAAGGWESDVPALLHNGHHSLKRIRQGAPQSIDAADHAITGHDVLNLPAGVSEADFTAAARLRFKLKCTLCGDSVTVCGEKLWPILDTLEAHGLGTISLAGLRGRL